MKKNINPPEKQLSDIIALFQKKKFKEALIEVKKLKKTFNSSSTVLSILGLIYRNLGENDKALQAYTAALLLKPADPEILNNIANTYKDKGFNEKAIVFYNKAIKSDPKNHKTLCNLGSILKREGEYRDAIQNYEGALKLVPTNVSILQELGNLFYIVGDFISAIEKYKMAININPSSGELYYNMGVAYGEQGAFEDSIAAYRNAINLDSRTGEAYNNLGVIYERQGALEHAIKAFTNSTKSMPNYAIAYINLGRVLQKQGKLGQAIGSYYKALLTQPESTEALYYFGNSLKDIKFTEKHTKFIDLISQVLDKKTLCRPKDLVKAGISLINLEQPMVEFKEKFKKTTDCLDVNLPYENLTKIPLFLHLMKIVPLPNLEIEEMLVKLRARFTLGILDYEISKDELTFLSALANQCFINEYLYPVTQSERLAIKNIEKIVSKISNEKRQPPSHLVLCLATYKPLYEYHWCKNLKLQNDISEVYHQQLMEIELENDINKNIDVLGCITDDTSLAVMKQYEESPYPRWVNLGLRQKPASISQLTQELGLKLTSGDITKVMAPHILVAGCGTGQHSISTARKFAACNVLAIDLSKSSLAYAQRKTQELGISNIKYLQADILNLKALNKSFDIVESTGVLHHMENPIEGWRALADSLNEGGLMRIALYSDLARQALSRLQGNIQKKQIKNDIQEIKQTRDEIIKKGGEDLTMLAATNDFYSTSSIRDLLFHAKEHRYTIPQIKEHLFKLKMAFCGFENSNIVSKFRQTYTNSHDLYNLDAWHKFEKNNPSTFLGMYQFWGQKI